MSIQLNRNTVRATRKRAASTVKRALCRAVTVADAVRARDLALDYIKKHTEACEELKANGEPPPKCKLGHHDYMGLCLVLDVGGAAEDLDPALRLECAFYQDARPWPFLGLEELKGATFRECVSIVLDYVSL
jgi:hypothetical protein